jgi:hypothetical protein
MSETPKARARNHILFALKVAAVMIAAALLVALARKQGWIDGELVVRASNIIVGLGLAALFNGWPKMLYGPPPRSIHDATVAQAVVRVSGWAMTLAFLAWAALWVFASQELALIGSIAALSASVAVMLGFTMWKCVACRTSRSD